MIEWLSLRQILPSNLKINLETGLDFGFLLFFFKDFSGFFR